MMFSQRYFVLSMTLASAIPLAPLAAQPAMPFGPPSFANFDLNHDGAITEQEFGEARAQRIKERSEQGYQMRGLANAPAFAEFDRNGDGRLDPTEFTNLAAQHRPPR